MKTKKFLAFIISALLTCVLSAFSTGAYADDGADQNATVTIGFTVARRQIANVEIGFTKTSGSGQTYTITYDLDGGEFEDENYPVSYDINSKAFTLPIPARLGYTFTGWALSEDTSIVPSTEVTIEKGSTGNRTYLAGWQIINYTITYNGVDGAEFDEANPASYTVESNAITLNNPAKKWHVFTGWNGTGIANGTMTVEIPKGSTGNRSYSATWQENNFVPDDENTPQIAFYSLLLGGQLGVMFYFYVPEGYKPSECTADFEISGKTSEYNQNKKYSRTTNSEGITFYGFECRTNG